MAKTDDDDRVEALKRRLMEISGGKMVAWESGALPPQMREQFWRSVLEFEEAEQMTFFQQLLDAGIELPEPESLGDEQLTVKLWEVINALAQLNTYISQTDHLSDRELYTLLWRETLREETDVLPEDEAWICDLQLLSNGSEENTRRYLQYYADESYRRQWLADFPDYDMPPHEDRPYDRDSRLPGPYL
jgi:hypothetical protein